MAEIDEIVEVNISRQTSVASMASFSEHLIADQFNPVGIKPRFDKKHRVRIFGSAADVAEAGFSTDSWVYKAAARQFSQSPHIKNIYVGWKTPSGLADSKITISAAFVTGNVIALTLNTVKLDDVSFDTEGSSNAVVEKIAEQINERFAGQMDASVSADNPLVIEIYGITPSGVSLQVTGGATTNQTANATSTPISADASWTDALNAMLNDANNGFYACEIHSDVQADLQEFALWVQANEKLGGIVTSDSTVVDEDSGDIADWLKINNIDRVFCFYHPSDPYFVSGLFGKILTKHPGSATWALKALEATATVSLSAGQRKTATAKNCNIYTSVSDLPLTRWGKVGSGEYIDVIHGCDWLKAKIQQLVLTTLAQQDKVPYEDSGIEAIKGQLKAGLEQGVTYQILKKGAYTIECPTADEVDAAAKAERKLPDVKFNAPLSGAIHKTAIDGVVTL